MKLISLQIRNFKGITSFDLHLDGRNATIRGDNGSGKTTIYDSLQWLFFGKNSAGAADFEVEPHDSRGQGIETSVTAALDVDNGIYTLERRRAENWVKERGSAEAIFKGYTTEYRSDGLILKEAAYKDLIASLCREDLFKLITNPRAFPALKWQEQRATLFAIAGGLTDEQIIAADPMLRPLEARGRHTVEDFKKIQQARRKELTTELNILPARINEATLAIKPDVDVAAAQARIEELHGQIEVISAEMTPKTDAELNANIDRLRLDLDALIAQNRTHIAAQEESARNTKREIVDGLRADLRVVEMDLDDTRRRLNSLREEDERLERRIKDLSGDYRKASELTWHGDNCPACGQLLPEDDVAPKRAAFNSDRANRLQSIDSDGRLAAARRKVLEEQAEPLNTKQSELAARKADLHKKLQDAEAMTWTTTDMPQYHERRDAISAEVAVLEADEYGLAQNEVTRIAKLRQQAQPICDEIALLEKSILTTENNAQYRMRVEELRGQQKAVAKELESCDRLIALCEDFTRAKVAAVEESINNKFRLARWKLFDTQINGAIVDCCVVTVGGVEYKDLNNAMQINVGLDIINTLCVAHQIEAPIFIDNAEAVTRLEPVAAQTVRLVVSEAHKTLVVELDRDITTRKQEVA